MKYINIANRFKVEIQGEESSSTVRYILSELKHHIEEDKSALPTVGFVDYDEQLLLPKRAVELRKGMLFESEDALFINNSQNIIRIHCSLENFYITIGRKADEAVAFFTVEMLIRYYAPLFNLVFTHTGAFIYEGKVCSISAFGGVGKTEVMLKAMEYGAQFVSDDFAIFNSEGEIFPYTKSIYLCEYPYDDYMLHKTGRKRWLWILKRFCEQHPNPLTTRIALRLEVQYFGIKLDYLRLTDKVADFRFRNVNSFYWVYSGSNTGRYEILRDEYAKNMKLCLDIESRRYFDYDGYLRLKFPFLEKNKQKQAEVIDGIARKNNVQGLTIRGREFNELAELIMKQNTNKDNGTNN